VSAEEHLTLNHIQRVFGTTVAIHGAVVLFAPVSGNSQLLTANANGDQAITGGKLTVFTATTTKAGLNVPPGVAPTTPVNGDVWTTAAGMFVRAGGATQQLAQLGSNTFTGIQIMPASTTSAASLRAPHGVAPTAPTDGDIWTTTAGVFVRVNGATVQLSTGGAGVTTFNTRSGAVTLLSSDVTTALGYTPVDPAAANSFSANLQTFGTTILLNGTAGIPAAGTSTTLYLTGSSGANNAGRMILGTGTGAINFTIVSRTGSADTIRHTFFDTGGYTATGTVTANLFSGSGASLTSLNGSNISSGTVADARLSTNVPLLNAATNVFTGALQLTATTAAGTPSSYLGTSTTSCYYVEATTGNGVMNATGSIQLNIDSNNNQTDALFIIKCNTAVSSGAGTTLFTVDETGKATATSFAGNGALVTNVNALTLNGASESVTAAVSTVVKRDTNSVAYAANHASIGAAGAAGALVALDSNGTVPAAAIPGGSAAGALTAAYLAW
jgi:hypothetical protein